MKISEKEYEQMNKKASPPTKSYKNLPMAFIIGGLICCSGQALGDWFLGMGIIKDDAMALASVSLIFIAALLTGLKIFEKIAKLAGAGTLVPITGFSNAITSMAMEAKSEGFIMGLGTKIFTIAGPVIVYGLCASVLYGIVYYIVNMFI